MPPSKLVRKLYQYYRISNTFLYAALFTRWLILFPLVGGKFLPGGMHMFLIKLMIYSTVGEIVWLFKFRSWKRAVLSRTMLKDFNFIFVILTLHYRDNYEYALVLRNISYSLFIVSLALSQCYVHCSNLFKQEPPRRTNDNNTNDNNNNTVVLRTSSKKTTILSKIYSFVILPTMYTSEFNLLLLNVQYSNFNNLPWLQLINKIILVLFIPVVLTCWKRQWQKLLLL